MGTDNKNSKRHSKTAIKKFNYEIAVTRDDDADPILLHIEKCAVYCETCQKPLSIKFKENYISILCGCGMRLFYPCGENKIYHSKFVTANEYKEMKQFVKRD